MNSSRGSKLSLFLMELIIAILFFSVSAAVCVRLFASAHILAERTEGLNHATKWSESLSEVFWGEKGNIIDISDNFPDSYIISSASGDVPDAETLIIVFDENWNVIDHSLSEASYEAMLKVEKKDASEVYSDITDYSVVPVGKAMVGKIAIIDIRENTEVLSEFPSDSDKVIFRSTIDYYLGEEAN